MPTTRSRYARALLATALASSAVTADAAATTLVTSFRIESDDAACAHVADLAGRSDPGPARRLAVWLRAGTGARVAIARDVAVAADGTWRLTLTAATAPIALDGLTVQRWLICGYDAGDPRADPGDPATLDCGAHPGGGADPRYDVDLDTLAVETVDGGRTRRVDALALARDLRVALAFVLDGREPGGGDGTSGDVAWSWHDFEATPPGRALGAYRASDDCPPPADAASEWCDPAPRIAAAPSSGGELAHVHGGVLIAAPGHALIALASEAREPTLPAAPFSARVGSTISVTPTAVGCAADPADGDAAAAAAAALTRGTSLLAVLHPATRRRPRSLAGREGPRLSRPECKANALQNRKATAPQLL